MYVQGLEGNVHSAQFPTRNGILRNESRVGCYNPGENTLVLVNKHQVLHFPAQHRQVPLLKHHYSPAAVHRSLVQTKCKMRRVLLCYLMLFRDDMVNFGNR